MLTSSLGVVAILALLALAAGLVNPIISLVVFGLAAIPLGVMLIGRVFRHAAPQANTTTGPAVPSSGEAAYDPVAESRDR